MFLITHMRLWSKFVFFYLRSFPQLPRALLVEGALQAAGEGDLRGAPQDDLHEAVGGGLGAHPRQGGRVQKPWFNIPFAQVTSTSRGEHEISHDCFDCGETFTNKPALQVHIIMFDQFNSSQDHEQKCRSDFDFTYIDCGKGFNTQRGLNVHERSCSVHDCFDCGMEFNTKKELKKHMSLSHK